MIVDLHVHSRGGSFDSIMSAAEASSRASTIGVDRVVLSEHSRTWTPDEHNLMGAREYSTNYGHIIVIGALPQQHNPSAQEIREHLDVHGGVMVIAHPFRYLRVGGNLLFPEVATNFDLQRLAEHPIFDLVDEVEVLNGGCTDAENELARQVARLHGMNGVAGSDAHAPSEVGHCATAFRDPIASLDALVDAIRRGHYVPVARQRSGRFAAMDGEG